MAGRVPRDTGLPHTIEIVDVDEATKTVRTHEHGGMLKTGTTRCTSNRSTTHRVATATPSTSTREPAAASWRSRWAFTATGSGAGTSSCAST